MFLHLERLLEPIPTGGHEIIWPVIDHLSCFGWHLCIRINGLIVVCRIRPLRFEIRIFNHVRDVSRDCWSKLSRTNSDAVIGLEHERTVSEPKLAWFEIDPEIPLHSL